jgi:hypothetical protein
VNRQATATAFDRLVGEKLRQPKLCTGCGKPRPDRGSPRCPDCVLEDQRLSAIAKLPPPPPEDDALPVVRGLRADRIPGSVKEARTLIAYNERILETSQSPQRRDRAARMLANVRPVLARLEHDETERLTRTAPQQTSADDEFEVVWSGKASLSSMVHTDGDDELEFEREFHR